MPTIPCERRYDCAGVLDADNPVANLSAEAPDIPVYRSIGYNGDLPPGGSLWSSFGCLGVCTSTVSQQDADICAANQAWLCNNYKGSGISGAGGSATTYTPATPGTPSGGSASPRPGPSIYYNSQQVCDSLCPDGSTFTYTFAAGQIAANSQYAADTAAYSIACSRAVTERICLSALFDQCCIDSVVSAQVIPSSSTVDFMAITAGAMPTGLTLDPITGIVVGTTTVAGEYTFTITASLTNGSVVARTYDIAVIQITNNSPLADMWIGDSATMVIFTASAGTEGALSWQVESGVVPTGLFLDEATGVLYGEPTLDATFNFEISVQDQAS